MTRLRAVQFGAITAGATFALVTLLVWAIIQGQGGGGVSQGGGATPATIPAPTPSNITQNPTPTPPDSNTNLRETNDVRVYRMVKDAVVNISATRVVTAQVSTGNDIFDRFAPQYRQVPAQSLGSGFVIHPSGYIITNEHVVEEGTDVQCVFFNGEKLPAEVIATDNAHDLAVLKVTPRYPLHAIELGSSEDLMIGEPAYAIGNPFGFAGTMTGGIISETNRTLDFEDKRKSYSGLIQTSASMNAGNSGGPLLNAYGQVIGINTAIRQGATGIGFAISVSNMRDLLPEFLNPDALNRAQIGFTLQEKRKTEPPATVLSTVLVEKVQPDSMAESAGLKNDDQLTAVGIRSADTPVKNVIDALVALGGAKPGDTLALQVLRAGKTLHLQFLVAKSPPLPSEIILQTRMGIRGTTVTAQLVSRYKLAINKGVYVDVVDPGSPAATTGIQPGDVLIQLGIYRVNSIDDVAALLKQVTQPQDPFIFILRGTSVLRGNIPLKGP